MKVRPVDTMKAKQFQKGVEQLAQEGAIQIYHTEYNDIVLGAVGALQFEVFEYRLKNEYNSEIRMEPMDFSVARWVKNKKPDELKPYLNSRISLVFDHFERHLLLFANMYTLNNFQEKYEDIELIEALAVDDRF